MELDKYTIYILELILVAIFIYSLIKYFEMFLRGKKGAASATVVRSNQSMNTLYTMYTVTAVIVTLTVEVSKGFDGNKAAIIMFNYMIITYLYFYSSWFRNSIFFPEITKIKTD